MTPRPPGPGPTPERLQDHLSLLGWDGDAAEHREALFRAILELATLRARCEAMRRVLEAIERIACSCGNNYLLGNCGCRGRAEMFADDALSADDRLTHEPGCALVKIGRGCSCDCALTRARGD